MRFMLMVKATGYYEAGIRVSREQSEARFAYIKLLQDAGVYRSAEELQPSSVGIRVAFPPNGGAPQWQAGPFSRDQEWISEYLLIDVGTEKEALEWALRMPIAAGQGECEVEIRRLESNEEDSFPPNVQTMEADLQDQLSIFKNR